MARSIWPCPAHDKEAKRCPVCGDIKPREWKA